MEKNKKIHIYQVDEKLYRSRQLREKHYPFLIDLGIRTLINLRYFNQSQDHREFKGKELELLNYPLKTWNIKAKQVAEILWMIRCCQEKGKVLVHCYHGADRTGLIIAMYRVIYQSWSMEAAKKELLEGPFGFHSIWRNIRNFFSQENEAKIRAFLAEYQA